MVDPSLKLTLLCIDPTTLVDPLPLTVLSVTTKGTSLNRQPPAAISEMRPLFDCHARVADRSSFRWRDNAPPVRNCRHLTRGISAACRGTAMFLRERARFTSDGSDKVRARVVSRTPRPLPPIHREIQPTASVITRSILANFTSLAKRRRSCTERDAQRLDIVEDNHGSFRFRSGVEAAQRSQTDRRRRGCLGHRGPGGDARSWLCRHVRRRPVVRPANRHDLPGVSHRVPGADPVRAVVQAERLPD